MLKIYNQCFSPNNDFRIRNTWRRAIANSLNIEEEEFPFHFKIVEMINEDKTKLYLCESIPDTKGEKVQKIFVTIDILNYLLGVEVDNCNVGLYFNDYLPIENEKILIQDAKDQLKIYPLLFKLNVSEYLYNKKKCAKLEFNLFSLLDDTSYSIEQMKKNSWKLLSGDDTYMTDVEKMYQDTFIHKGYVSMVCNKFADYLEKNDEKDEANAIRARAKVHDNSKILNKDEFRALTGIINDKTCLRDASAKLSQFKQDSIELHWAHNAHHPEHFEDINQMSKIDRMEMCCDWASRAMQYHTNLLEFAEKRQVDRFHFPELMYDEIYHYCKILVNILNI